MVDLSINRGYYMATWGYESYLLNCAESLSQSFASLTCERYSKIKFVSPRGHVISSIYTQIYMYHECKTTYVQILGTSKTQQRLCWVQAFQYICQFIWFKLITQKLAPHKISSPCIGEERDYLQSKQRANSSQPLSQ